MRKLLAIMLILCSAVFGQKSKLIISVSGELEMDLADVLMDGVSYGLKNNNKYEILINDRQFKETLKKEWDKGNISDDRIIALAKTAGAAYLCFTKIKVANGLKGKQVTAHMYNLSTMSYVPGEMGMVTIKDDFYDLEDLTKIILNVVADMLGIAKDNSVRQTSKVSKDARDGKEASSSNNTYTPKSQGGNFFTDSRDGKKYKTVKIGKQTWMAENLNYNANGSKCNNNQESNCSNYGRLYNWATAMNACPSGWHLPNKSEWEVLTATVGGEETEGKYLKATSGWDSYNGQSGNGQDTYGFSALPGGFGSSDGYFDFAGLYGSWWSPTEDSGDNAYYRLMGYEGEDALWFYHNKSFLFSVRCLQDDADYNAAKAKADVEAKTIRKTIGGPFTDSRDNKTYKTTKIGSQTWMAENLNYNANGSKCNNNQESNCSNYGRLYNWATAMNACPSGWHLPSKSEWEVLTATVGGKETEGKYLKATSGWDSYNGQSGNGQDTYGFSALPGGQGISNGNAFYFPGIYGYWWSASEISASLADSRYMSFNFDAGWFNGDKSTHLLSVRCLQD